MVTINMSDITQFIRALKRHLEVRPNAIVEVRQTVADEQNFRNGRRRCHTSMVLNKLLTILKDHFPNPPASLSVTHFLSRNHTFQNEQRNIYR